MRSNSGEIPEVGFQSRTEEGSFGKTVDCTRIEPDTARYPSSLSFYGSAR